jgi:hypothetical protein
MYTMPEQLRFTEDGPVPRLYAWNLLHRFHALSYPERYLENPLASTDPNASNDLSRVSPGEPALKSELLLVKPGQDLAVISGEIANVARPVLDFMTRFRPRHELRRATEIYCQQQIRRYDRDEPREFVDANNRPLTAGQILPPSSIIKAMHETWNIREVRRCHPLEKYIGEVLAQSRPAA